MLTSYVGERPAGDRQGRPGPGGMRGDLSRHSVDGQGGARPASGSRIAPRGAEAGRDTHPRAGQRRRVHRHHEANGPLPLPSPFPVRRGLRGRRRRRRDRPGRCRFRPRAAGLRVDGLRCLGRVLHARRWGVRPGARGPRRRRRDRPDSQLRDRVPDDPSRGRDATRAGGARDRGERRRRDGAPGAPAGPRRPRARVGLAEALRPDPEPGRRTDRVAYAGGRCRHPRGPAGGGGRGLRRPRWRLHA
jgi:hypothetical protein